MFIPEFGTIRWRDINFPYPSLSIMIPYHIHNGWLPYYFPIKSPINVYQPFGTQVQAPVPPPFAIPVQTSRAWKAERSMVEKARPWAFMVGLQNWWFWAIGLCNTRTEVLFWGYSFRSIHAKNTPTIEDIPQHGSRKCVVGRFQLVGLITQTIFSAALWSLWMGWTNLQRPRIIAPTIQIIHVAGLSRVIQGLHGLSRSFQPNMWHFPSIFSRAPWSSKTNVDSIRNGHLRGLGKNQGYHEMTCLQ